MIAAQLKEAKLDAYCEALKDLSQELAFVDQLKNLETSLDHEIGRVENMNRREIGISLNLSAIFIHSRFDAREGSGGS